MQHRIRGAGIAIRDNKILLVKHCCNGDEFWVPAGGGLEAQDNSTSNAAVREYYEETGLKVTVGPLIYIREFHEKQRDCYHLEMFYLIDSLSGDITMKNLKGLGGDEFDIKAVEWIHRDDIHSIKVYPEELYTKIWDKIDNKDYTPEYLGVST